MLALSSKVGYALSALFELAGAEKDVPTQIRIISKRHSIPQHYLEQVLVVLKQHGFVKSVRGAAGGYLLACKPSDIRVLDVITCLEGPPKLVQKERSGDPLYEYWRRCENELKTIFSDTLQDLIQKLPAPTEAEATGETAESQQGGQPHTTSF